MKFPLALPVIMLGLNQTITYGLAMLVIAALVAMIADRIIQCWNQQKREELGL